jgi:hypothetical protein
MMAIAVNRVAANMARVYTGLRSPVYGLRATGKFGLKLRSGLQIHRRLKTEDRRP